MTMLRDPNLDLLLDAALVHVPFDGWSLATLRGAAADVGLDNATVQSLCPRGAVDLAVSYHERGDQEMLDRIAQEDLSGLKFRDRIAAAVRFRLEVVEDKELVRRGTTLFALPQYAPDGARAVWQTCDRIWTALGDTSEDVNWYSKRATLAGVYTATVLYWLGDSSPDHAASWAFLNRRIDNVMQIEKLKAGLRENAAFRPFMAAPNWFLGQIKAPRRTTHKDLPGVIDRRR